MREIKDVKIFPLIFQVNEVIKTKTKMYHLIARLRPIWSSFCDLYTSNTTKTWKEKLLLVFSCFTSSLILSSLILLILHFSFKCNLEVSAFISCGFCVCLTPAIYFSERARCFAALLLISMGLKQVRSLLLTFGTSLVIFFNIQNTYQNGRLLAKGLICNLEEKLLNINIEPLGNYIKMLKWVGKQLKYFLSFNLVSYHADFKLTPKVNSESFKIHMVEAERALNETARNVLMLTDALSSVGKILSPTLGLFLLLLLTALYLRRFRIDNKYNNVYITKNFLRFDEEQREKGKPCVLPFTKSELKRYIMTPSLSLTAQRWKAMLKFSIPIFTHCLTWLVFISLDSFIYWLIVVLSKRLGDLEPLRVPVEESAKWANFSYTVSLFEKKCLPEPELWLHRSLVPLSLVLVFLLFLSLLSSQLTQLRVLLSEQFYSDVAERRTAYLHAKILKKRHKYKADELEGDLKTSVMQVCTLYFKVQCCTFSKIS